MKSSYSDMKVADNLRSLRARHRMTQQEAAYAINVSIATIANWESGKGGMSFESAWKLANLFGCSLGELSGTEETHSAA